MGDYMRGFKFVGTARNRTTGEMYIMYGRKNIVTLYETDKDFSYKNKTDMNFEMSARGMVNFACNHKEMIFSQDLTL